LGKNKLARWAEIRSFNNVIEPSEGGTGGEDHPLKGRWRSGCFKNNSPVVLELGCGKGEYTVGLARRFPGKNFIGIDIKGARIWRGAKSAFEEKLPNVFFIRTRIEFVASLFAEDEINEIWITFPDPFPRAKNENRRLVSPMFLNIYRKFLVDKGLIHLKTDNHHLYRYAMETAQKNRLEITAATDDLYGSGFENEILSITTHYENLFRSEGKKINYLSFRLEKQREIEDAQKGKKLQ
jgi:tRNA (guanine-N7-)-methyltransferase